jgi:hypothetical protein
MEDNVGILPFGSRRVTRSTEVFAVAGDKNPILFQDDPLEFPVFPSRVSDPYHMRSLMVPSLPRHERKFRAEAFVDQQLRHYRQQFLDWSQITGQSLPIFLGTRNGRAMAIVMSLGSSDPAQRDQSFLIS